jgi:hypothetical protein
MGDIRGDMSESCRLAWSETPLCAESGKERPDQVVGVFGLEFEPDVASVDHPVVMDLGALGAACVTEGLELGSSVH